MVELYDRLSSTTDEELTEKVSEQDDFSSADLEIQENTKRDDYNLDKTKKRIKWLGFWLIGIALGLTILGLLASTAWLFSLYITDVAKDLNSVKELLKNWLNYVLIVLATLFIERIFSKS